ncbi:MAG: Holliday junction resolvase-like protein [Candidatus Daviesbacteria bacterium]|nr:Holliday junction resolvase-like protein [Candidatus Daviesbacteria bacterium]
MDKLTMDQTFIYILIGILALLVAYLFGRLHRKGGSDIPTDLIDLYKGLQDLPARVLQTIQGSINPQKGKMAELLTYAELRYDYDRIIPLGQPVDFIGIKNNERIDFIEVKSGNFHVLTEEEKHIKNLITTGRVNFRLIKVSEEEVHGFVTRGK